MKLYAPSYYNKFKCIADLCRHSCCKGWEIDIDRESYARYLKCPGDIGKRLRASIVKNRRGEETPAHFRLSKKEESCPFLNEKGLCDLILELGEDSLCQICRDHPRFRNYWTDRVEIGLGMACEEAARVILSQTDKVRLVLSEEDEHLPEEQTAEKNVESDSQYKEETADTDMKQAGTDAIPEEELALLSLRDQLTEILQDRSQKTDERILQMLEFCRLEQKGHMPQFTPGPLNETACEQLAVYLLYRHLADALYDGKLEERIRFVADSYAKVRNAWAEAGKTEIESLIEPARAFSEDVEYDTDTWGL